MKFTRAVLAVAAIAVAAAHAAPSPLSADVGANVGVAAGVSAGPVAVGVDANVDVDAHVDIATRHAKRALRDQQVEAAAKQAGIDLSKSPLSFDQFQQAVTAAGLPVPGIDTFLGFLGPLLGPGGSTAVTAAQIALKLTDAIVKGAFGALNEIKADDVLTILSIVTKVLAGGIKAALP
ncbi:hypothetical protein GQ42DRAFT_165115 [Ramicandelaber brevisporus]|nr:hypothetical protein GQ42DRAFT_165115 [Ramicandelaber brevisporus]